MSVARRRVRERLGQARMDATRRRGAGERIEQVVGAGAFGRRRVDDRLCLGHLSSFSVTCPEAGACPFHFHCRSFYFGASGDETLRNLMAQCGSPMRIKGAQ